MNGVLKLARHCRALLALAIFRIKCPVSVLQGISAPVSTEIARKYIKDNQKVASTEGHIQYLNM
jgi:hypothetical protein